MKKRTSRLLSLVLAVSMALGLALPASAAESNTVQVGPYTFTLNYAVDADAVHLTGYDSSLATSTHADIPASVTGENGQVYPVTRISDHAFEGTDITSVTVPDSVITIGGFAFRSCNALTNVKLSENLISIGQDAFASCDALREITIPASVEEMDNPFAWCTGLDTVYMEGMVAPYFNTSSMNLNDEFGPTVFVVPQGSTGYEDWASISSVLAVIHEGEPIPSYGLSLSTTSLDFGSGLTGYDEPVKTVTVTNTGDRPLRVTLPKTVPNYLLSWDSEDMYNYKNKTLEPGESAPLFVEALNYRYGTKDTTVTITTEEGPSATLSLFYTVLAPSLQVSADTDSIDFGTVEEGYTQPAARTITYTNHDNYGVLLSLSSNSYGGFLISDLSPYHVEANGTSTLTVQPKAGLAPGTHTWEARVLVESSGESVYITTPLTFTVVAAGTLPEEPEPEQPAQTFTDVTPDAWYYSFVETVAEKGLFAGNGDGTFAPENNMTYAEFLAVLFQFSGDTLPANSGPNWYDNHVQWAKNSGVIPSAMLAGFDPEAAITRQDMAALFGSFLTRYDYEAAPVNTGTPSFSDESDIAGYAKDGVTLCYQLGIMGGNDDGTFAPGNTAIRAEVAVTMVQMARVMGR